ncbi:hypothetical protein H4696_002753 [Amycolatopsis lexingtonensis]|uniref:Uncharacterized protein n=1 Tax=Amycolatopsis lexingtonensis TaxID=218822 RepID=A0ABR9HXM7_9PSEU|nr:hypothetical protein [Amycolatopsis lexingtonensis]MBE1495653.1 hypothetical protein [Amycolatopsis lexingtonensis]
MRQPEVSVHAGVAGAVEDGAGFAGVVVAGAGVVAVVVTGAGSTEAESGVLVDGDAPWSAPHPARASPHPSATTIACPRTVSSPG